MIALAPDFAPGVVQTLGSSGGPGGVALMVALIGGLVLWGAGRRVLKPMFVMLCALFLAFAGFLLAPVNAFEYAPLVGLAGGAVIGAITGMMLYRLSMALSLGVVLALVFPVATGAVLRANPDLLSAANHTPLSSEELLLEGVPVQGQPPEGKAEGNAALDQWHASSGSSALDDFNAHIEGRTADAAREVMENITAEQAIDVMRPLVERAQRFGGEVVKEAWAEWQSLAVRERLVLGGAGLLGLMVGVLAGLTRPGMVASVTTAGAGAAAWVPAAGSLIKSNNLTGAEQLPDSVAQWLIVWAAAALIGVFVQVMTMRRRADKSESKGA